MSVTVERALDSEPVALYHTCTCSDTRVSSSNIKL